MNKDIIERSIKEYGRITQSVICMEECSELIQAVSKQIRGIGSKENLIEEMADVAICLEMLKDIYDIDDTEIGQQIQYKQDRMEQRMDREEICEMCTEYMPDTQCEYETECKMMETLTRRSTSGEAAFTFDLYINCLPSEAKKILNLATKLKEYEDLEEQCRLIKLPCKVGDKIFLDFAGFGKDIDKFTVKDFHLDCFEDGETTLFCDYESNDRTFSGQIDVMEFGKTVFLTKSEAEAKLKELRGKNE